MQTEHMARATIGRVPDDKITKEEFHAHELTLRTALLRAQEDLADRDFPVILCIDGPDLTGGDDVFERLHEWFDARFLRSDAYGAPTAHESGYPWLWRYWLNLPPVGTVWLVRRSWTASLIARRSFGELDDATLGPRIAHVQRLERQFAAEGALILKFWLHVDKDTLERRLDKARKKGKWTVQEEEWALAKHYDEGRDVARRVLRETDTEWAPWHVLRGDDRRARDLEVGTRIVQALRHRLDASHASPPPLELAPARPRAPQLAEVDLDARGPEEAGYDRLRHDYQARITTAHRKAVQKQAGVVFVFEGWDAAGKGGAIRRLVRAMDAQHYKIFPIAAPDAREKSRPWLWRFWRRLPTRGKVSVFDRSWYGRVLVERVERFASEADWQRAYAETEDFERQLVEHGYLLVKFFLHLSDAEQLRRFEARREVAYKRHKLTDEDWCNREKRGAYEAAVDEMLARTGSVAPWHVVAADDKHHARLEVLRLAAEELEAATSPRS